MDTWTTSRLMERFALPSGDVADVRIEDLGALPVGADFVVWHPLDDIHAAPRVALGAQARVEAIWVRDELAGYRFRTAVEPVTWTRIGDASTSCDRFFLVPVEEIERAIDWFNEVLLEFESLGGNLRLEVVSHGTGCRLAVIQSGDGNAVVYAGASSDGAIVAAMIET